VNPSEVGPVERKLAQYKQKLLNSVTKTDDIRHPNRTCNTHERDEKCTQNFRRTTGRENHVEGLGLDEKIILEWILVK